MEETISLKTCLRTNSRMCCMRLLMSGLKAEKCTISPNTGFEAISNRLLSKATSQIRGVIQCVFPRMYFFQQKTQLDVYLG